MRRTTVSALLLAAATAAGGVWACTDSNAPKVQQPPPPPPPPAPPPPPPQPAPAWFGIRPALDTVIAGDLVKFVAERADSTVDQWIVSDTRLARLLGHERGWSVVRIRAPGTVTIKATRGADSGLATLVILPPHTTPGPVTIGDWEAISLGLMTAEAGGATAIDEQGTIVGFLREIDEERHQYLLGYGFIYKDGVMRKLWSSETMGSDYVPMAIGASGMVAGMTFGFAGTISGAPLFNGGQLLVWDSADAAPRMPSHERLYRFVGINAQGDMLVSYGDHLDSGSGIVRAVLWRDNVRVDLGTLNDAEGHGAEAFATAWNAAGQIVGGSKVASVSHGDGDWTELFHPFIWENGGMRDLGLLGPFPCGLPQGQDCGHGWATGINAHGVVVGVSTADSLLSRAFIWEHGVMRDLGAFPGHNTRALAINDHGQVLATAADEYSDPDTVFVWDNDQVQVVTTTAVGGRLWLGPNGEVVGMMGVGDTEPHAFIWQAGALTDLGRGYVNGYNNRGEIVGARGNMPTLWRRKS
jgi:probable HAF family extracellular repeat protein